MLSPDRVEAEVALPRVVEQIMMVLGIDIQEVFRRAFSEEWRGADLSVDNYLAAYGEYCTSDQLPQEVPDFCLRMSKRQCSNLRCKSTVVPTHFTPTAHGMGHYFCSTLCQSTATELRRIGSRRIEKSVVSETPIRFVRRCPIPRTFIFGRRAFL